MQLRLFLSSLLMYLNNFSFMIETIDYLFNILVAIIAYFDRVLVDNFFQCVCFIEMF